MKKKIVFKGMGKTFGQIASEMMQEHNEYYGQPCGEGDRNGAQFLHKELGVLRFCWAPSMDYPTGEARRVEQNEWVQEQLCDLQSGSHEYKGCRWKTSGGNLLFVSVKGDDLIVTGIGNPEGIPWRFLPYALFLKAVA